jgi:hypothetical protein
MAGSKKDSFENALLLLIFNNTTITGIGSDGLRGSTTAGSFYIALQTAAATESAQGTEANYTGYARVAVARTAGGWTVTGNNAYNTAAVTFGTCTAGSSTVVTYTINKAGTVGVDDAIYWADLPSSLAISTTSNQTPEIAICDLDVFED